MNDWQVFVVQSQRVIDCNGNPHLYTLPPSWRVELLIWELFKSFKEEQTLDSILSNIDIVLRAVSFALDLFPEDVESLFSEDDLGIIFSNLWEYISPDPDELKNLEAASKRHSQHEFSLAQALAMFGLECGWLPSDILNMPRQQVLALAEAVSSQLADKMKFSAAIHGIEMDGGGAEKGGNAQIEDEGYWKSLASQGLPVEVK